MAVSTFTDTIHSRHVFAQIPTLVPTLTHPIFPRIFRFIRVIISLK